MGFRQCCSNDAGNSAFTSYLSQCRLTCGSFTFVVDLRRAAWLRSCRWPNPCQMKVHTKGTAGLRCKCGYRFALQATMRRRKFASFAVIDNGEYQAFLKSERGVLRARGERAKLQAIARSSKYVGCLFECPKCSRVLLLKPFARQSEGDWTSYMKEG